MYTRSGILVTGISFGDRGLTPVSSLIPDYLPLLDRYVPIHYNET